MIIRRIQTSLVSIIALLMFVPSAAQAQAPAATFQLPTVIVTAQKESAKAQELPVSLSTVTQQTLRDSGASIVSELFAPNVYFTEFTARKLSNPRFRGI